jgi:streptomycin 6-kinase
MFRPEVALHIEKWMLVPDGAEIETPSSWLLRVKHQSTPAMLKTYKPTSDEHNGTDYLKYIDGEGAVRILAADDSALLMERASGTRSLTNMSLSGEDLLAATIFSNTIARLHTPRRFPIPDTLVPLERQFKSLFMRAHEHATLNVCAAVAQSLLASQTDVIPLHGDLHHSNILDGGPRGWLVIDPKALIGERTYDVANFFGNPWPHTAIVHSSTRVVQMATLFSEELKLDRNRVLAFAFAHAGLAASWDIDEGASPEYRLKCADILAPFVKL